jgi:hypothetical protein
MPSPQAFPVADAALTKEVCSMSAELHKKKKSLNCATDPRTRADGRSKPPTHKGGQRGSVNYDPPVFWPHSDH